MHNLYLKMHYLCLMLATNTIFIELLSITLTKRNFSLIPYRKSAKTHKLCIIVLINPSPYNFVEKIIFDLQLTIDRVHSVQIASCSDYWHIVKNTTNAEKTTNSPNLGSGPIYTARTRFFLDMLFSLGVG